MVTLPCTPPILLVREAAVGHLIRLLITAKRVPVRTLQLMFERNQVSFNLFHPVLGFKDANLNT